MNGIQPLGAELAASQNPMFGVSAVEFVYVPATDWNVSVPETAGRSLQARVH
jgi:hypothetical protein